GGPIAAVNALVAVSNEEQVVRSRRNHCAQKSQGLRAEVLRLIDDDRAVSGLGAAAAFREQRGRVAIRIIHLFQFSAGELSSILLEHRPDRVAFSAGENDTAARTSSHTVVVLTRDPL